MFRTVVRNSIVNSFDQGTSSDLVIPFTLQGSEADKAALKKALLEKVSALDNLVQKTDVLASTPSGAVSRRVEDAKRWAATGKFRAVFVVLNLSYRIEQMRPMSHF